MKNKIMVTILVVLSLMFLMRSAFANDISVSNVRLQNLDAAAGTVEINFDLSWDNYYNGTDANNQAYFDRAWVFVKLYRTDTGVWDHVPLSTGGTIAAYSSSTKTGITTDGVGAFCRPGANQTVVWQYTNVPVTMTTASPCVVTYANHGLIANSEITFSTGGALPTGITAGTKYYVFSPTANTFNITTTPGDVGTRVNTSGSQSGNHSINAPAIMFPDNIKVKILAIEMVYIPEGAFKAGDGTTTTVRGQFCTGTTVTSPYDVTSEAQITLGGGGANLGNNNASGMQTADDFNNATTKTLPAEFPKGYHAFFIMKHEITQGQYRDFLNTLGRTQQNTRTATSLASGTTSVTNRYVMSNTSTLSFRNGIRCDAAIHTSNPITFYCDLNGNGVGNEANDGEWIACNYLSWPDVAAYADWAGLRPMTELEYEKTTRGGNVTPVANEYGWGTTNITEAAGIAGAGTRNETATPAGANCAYNNNANVQGPLRTGFAATSSSNREQAGASYYGVMELSGNLWERPVTIGNSTGRLFSGLHGNGILNASGDADVTNWPGTGAAGSGYRGGDWLYVVTYARASDRYFAASTGALRYDHYGGRLARTSP